MKKATKTKMVLGSVVSVLVLVGTVTTIKYGQVAVTKGKEKIYELKKKLQSKTRKGSSAEGEPKKEAV